MNGNMASCHLCATTRPEEYRPVRMWMGQGLYWWPQSAQSAPPDDGWIFGLEDRYFPPEVAGAQAVDAGSSADAVTDGLTDDFVNFLQSRLTLMDSDADTDSIDSGSDKVADGLTEDFTNFLEKRLVRMDTCAQSLSECEGTLPEASRPEESVRRKRVMRSLSFQEAGVRLRNRRASGMGIDLRQLLKRWSTASSGIRRAFRKVYPAPQPANLSAPMRFSLDFTNVKLITFLLYRAASEISHRIIVVFRTNSDHLKSN